MTNNILLVDDLRVFRTGYDPEHETLYTARTSAEALEILEGTPVPWFRIWLDHDLGMVDGVEDTIMPVINYLSDRALDGNPVPVEMIIIHTSNPVGRDRMVQTLHNRGYNTTVVNASWYFDIDMDLYENYYLNLEE